MELSLQENGKKYIDIFNNERENIKITKLFNLKNRDIDHYRKHFGNRKNCPLCQELEQKHNETLKNLGIYPMIPNINNDSMQSSSKNRRIYSALSRVLSKRNRNNEFDSMNDNINNSSDNIDKEMSILMDVNHPNIIELKEIKKKENKIYLVMEYCNGGNLEKFLEKYQEDNKKPHSEEIVQYIMRQIVEGMKYLSNKNIMHRHIN